MKGEMLYLPWENNETVVDFMQEAVPGKEDTRFMRIHDTSGEETAYPMWYRLDEESGAWFEVERDSHIYPVLEEYYSHLKGLEPDPVWTT